VVKNVRLDLAHESAESDFAVVLRRLRRARGLSQEALAERAAISAKAVSALECGMRKSPHPKTIALLATALGLDESRRGELEGAAEANRAARNAALEDAGTGEFGCLPSPATAVIGREREVGDVHGLLQSERFVTIVGPGGIGKTTLALQAARTAQHRYANGASFVDLSVLSDGALVAGTIASARGLLLRTGGDPLAALGTALKTSSLLLVLDNCEHLVSDVARVVQRLLFACSRITILTTSRRLLGAPAEAVYRVPPLAAPAASEGETLTAARAGESAAVALFVQRATAVNAEFALSDGNAACVARICRRLDGIALAIELAAAQVRLMSVTELERRLGQRFRLLRDGARADRDRARTLLATFDWSYGLLSPRERSFFRALGIFAGSFSLDAALAICCDDDADELHALELLASLVDASLVVADSAGDATRYRLLETTRAYAADALVREGESTALSARHLAYFRANAAKLNLALELEDVRAALGSALEGGDVAAGADLLTAIGARWTRLGLATEGVARLEAFLPSIPGDDARMSARAWIALSFLRGHTMRLGPAFDAAQSGVAAARRADDDALLFHGLRAFATFSALHGSFDAASAALREAAEVAERCPSPVRRLLLLDTQGLLFQRRGELGEAARAFREAILVGRATGDPYLGVMVTSNLAEAEHEAGRTEMAVALLSELRADPALRRIDAGPMLANLAGYSIALDDDAGTFAAARDLVALRSHSPSSQVYVTAALEHIALAHVRRGNDALAARLVGYCDTWYGAVGYERQYTERRTHERLMTLLCERLHPEELAALMAGGALLSEEGAVREALDARPSAQDAVQPAN